MSTARIARLTARAGIIQAIRHYFTGEGYLEIDTPLLLPTIAPEANIDPVVVGSSFLQTSPELCMKRLLAAGLPRLFQIAHCWRERERGRLHLPEFTMLEWYRAAADYRRLMAETTALVRSLASVFTTDSIIRYNGMAIDVAGEWERITVREAYSRYGGMSMEEALRRDDFDRVMVERIEPQLGRERPTFLYDYPACRSALARLKPTDLTVAERFELYIAGIELANGFSELNDPVEQRDRFNEENRARQASGASPLPLAEKFLAALPSMPPAAGIAFGVDRLVMLLTGATTIDEVVAFTPEEL